MSEERRIKKTAAKIAPGPGSNHRESPGKPGETAARKQFVKKQAAMIAAGPGSNRRVSPGAS